ncbi:photosynthetic complex assembly protein PuhC [Roseicella frigidaeris]|nr:photosynthetic complex assembly protein PuhC [Roseicella frigidaeris]
MPQGLADRLAARIPGFGIAALLVTVLAAVALSGGTASAPVEAEPPLAMRTLRFADLPQGSIAVLDAATGATLARFTAGEGGFLRGGLRGLVRERRLDGGGAEAPFILAAWRDGRLTFEDSTTGRVLELHAYGQTNAEAFARFLTAREMTP